MKKFVLGILMLGLASANIHANLITNGDFEAGQLAGKRWQVFPSIEGWTTTSGHGIEIQRNTVVRAQSGNQYVELDSQSRNGPRRGNSALTQGLETVNGQNYWLSFYYLPRTNGDKNDNGLAVYWDAFDNVFDTFDPSHVVFSVDDWQRREHSEWTQFSMRLEATSDLMALSFGGTGMDNTLGAFIDNVSLTAVPAPGSLTLFGLGIAGLALIRKKV